MDDLCDIKFQSNGEFCKFCIVKALLNGLILFKCYTGVIWSLPKIETKNNKQLYKQLFLLVVPNNKVFELELSKGVSPYGPPE
jgi:hypothetical protein